MKQSHDVGCVELVDRFAPGGSRALIEPASVCLTACHVWACSRTLGRAEGHFEDGRVRGPAPYSRGLKM